jgi:hypothetical protein
MESLKSKKFQSFEKDQVMKLNLVSGGASGSTYNGGTDWTEKTYLGQGKWSNDWVYSNVVSQD